MKKDNTMMMKEFTEYQCTLGRDEAEALCPAERLLQLGIDPFSFFRKKRKSMKIDEDEYNDDFDDEPGSIDEEPEDEDDGHDMISYIHDDDETEKYDLSKVKEFPLLRAVLLYNNNRRIYYA